MNKSAKILIVVVVLALVYAAASWFIGTKVETIMDEQYALVERNPSVKIVKRDYVRGIFTATETATFEFSDIATGPLRITVLTHIKHGPFPGFKTVAAAAMDAELVTSEFSDDVRKMLTDLFGDKKPLEIHSVVHLDGAGRTTLKVPSGELTAEGRHIALRGLELDVDFTRNLGSYTFNGRSGGFEYRDEDIHMQMSGLSGGGDAKLMFEDDPLLYIGKQNFAMDSFRMEAVDADMGRLPVVLEKVSMVADTPVNGDMIDVVVLVDMQTQRIGDAEYGPAHYGISLRNLHARTLSSLYAVFSNLSTNEYGMPENLASLTVPAFALLTYDPVFNIDRIDFNSPYGATSLKGYIKLNDVRTEDADNPFELLGKLEIGADISIPEVLFGKLATREAESEEEAAEWMEEITAQVDDYVDQGFVSRAEGVLTSKVLFKDEALMLNGVPFDQQEMDMEEDEDDILEEDILLEDEE